MTKRLETDAKIVLNRAGYVVKYRGYYLDVYEAGKLVESLKATGGTVNNIRVCELLKAKGFGEYGYPLPDTNELTTVRLPFDL